MTTEETRQSFEDVGRPLEQHRSHLRFAERLVRAHRDDLRHVTGAGDYTWTGTHWQLDQTGTATRFVIATLKAAYADLADFGPEDRKELLADISKCESASGIEGVIRIARNLHPFATSVDQLDADPYLVNTSSGTLDLRTGNLSPADPADLITKIAGTGYEPAARSEAFEKFVGEILPDPDVRAFVQRVRLRVAWPCRRACAAHHVRPRFEREVNVHRTRMRGVRRLRHSSRTRSTRRPRRRPHHRPSRSARRAPGGLQRNRRQAPTRSSDSQKIDRRRQDPSPQNAAGFLQFDASHTVILVTSHKPQVAADDPELWRRVRVGPFDVVVDKPNVHLREQVATRAAGDPHLDRPGLRRLVSARSSRTRSGQAGHRRLPNHR